ncbi:hypothetical protein H310_12112 [Aphanomyces invadans]|uniref:Cilia- and flagella-associated protein 300 n=1 Tax=Aphanomyces invadans TaxID=157072 RepID=A0A024TJC4_9STRA|nr:hypothetical protein H310_12112 [Aphanomyces invadans]ETV94094.1 hypothetical protein H310_12112 [Aphanomyces invadans]|eukprot:XP_008877297.1 hypothetical protein H310_12112 [Aphanomyces invadans]
MATAHDEGARYTFESIPVKTSPWETGEMKLKLMQWNLDQHGGVKRFRMRGKFDPANATAFLRAFFESKSVRASVPFPSTVPSTLDDLSFRKLKTNVLSMEFFNKLEASPAIVSSGGVLRRCMDEVYDDCTVNDSLRDMVVNPLSDHAGFFSASEQDEAIFQVFKRLVIGGAMAQHDETLQPYLNMTKLVYKALVSVQKKSTTDDAKAPTPLAVMSHVYLLHTPGSNDGHNNQDVSKSTRQLFPKPDSPYNACFVSIDPHNFTVLCWYAPFVPFW